ncbi:MAG: ParB N-terminal domain-containing protein, partial [Alphaproteobacteria bacterium]|nr:ParB N-terminal domain-containing protein [Alphaproteobacteria bacterium]
MATTQAPGVLKRTSAYFIDPHAVVRKPGFNPRFDFGEIDALATSIRANGVLNAIRVKRMDPTPEGYLFELIDGDRRLTAIESILEKDADAFKEGVPAIIVDRAQDDITSLIQMFEANSGKMFVPLEEAFAYKRMRDAGMTLAQIESAVGRKVPHIADMLTLLNADDSVKEAVTDGTIGKQMAKTIAK